VPVLLGFTFFMGLMLAPDRHGAGLQERHRPDHDRLAGTAGVFFVMASLAT
jgi:modulator of FtsH protease